MHKYGTSLKSFNKLINYDYDKNIRVIFSLLNVFHFILCYTILCMHFKLFQST